MKKVLVLILLLGFGALIYYATLDKKTPLDDFDDDMDDTTSETKEKKSFFDNVPKTDVQKKEVVKDTKGKKKDYADAVGRGHFGEGSKEAREFASYVNEVEGRWKDEVRDFIKSELGMGDEIMGEYDRIKESFNEARMEALELYNTRTQSGEFESEEEITEAEMYAERMMEEHEGRLRNLFGEKNFEKYEDRRDEFNDMLEEDQTSNKGGAVFIDF